VNADALKKEFGDQYPVAVVVDGIRLPLRREGRFMRYYYSSEHKLGRELPRFMDGSASISLSEVRREWHTWSDHDRIDFCQYCCWLHEQPDFPDMLRFVVQHASPREWSGVAVSIGSYLPRDEAFDILVRALRTAEIGNTSNIGQAIAITKHPEAESTLRHHLQIILAHRGLWDNAEFSNWVAFDAITCIGHLIELGAEPREFEEHVRQLAEHACAGNRRSSRTFLSKHYGWLT
jgi:hypothetical protein